MAHYAELAAHGTDASNFDLYVRLCVFWVYVILPLNRTFDFMLLAYPLSHFDHYRLPDLHENGRLVT